MGQRVRAQLILVPARTLEAQSRLTSAWSSVRRCVTSIGLLQQGHLRFRGIADYNASASCLMFLINPTRTLKEGEAFFKRRVRTAAWSKSPVSRSTLSRKLQLQWLLHDLLPGFSPLGMKGTGKGHIRTESVPTEIADSQSQLIVRGGAIQVHALKMNDGGIQSG